MIRFLQVSDIHFLYCSESEDEYSQLRMRFKEDLECLKKKVGAIPYLLICGDVASKGQSSEFKAATTFIQQLCETLEVDGHRPNVFVVPGNHDIDRTPYKYTREHFRSKLLCFENKQNDYFMQELRKSEPYSLKILYLPLKAYTKFADDYSSNDELAEALNLEGTCSDLTNKNLFWKRPIGKIGNYTINIVGLNSTLVCDGMEREFPDSSKGEHTLFLPFMGYNVVTRSNEVNISMIHHPINWLGNEDKVQNIFDDRFKIQFYGHMHKQSSSSGTAIKIYSGALQPPSGDDDYPPVYNYIEVDIKDSNLMVSINCRKWDGRKFVKYVEECKSYTLPLIKEDLWNVEDKNDAQKELHIESTPIPTHEIIQLFRIQAPAVKKQIISEMESEEYNKQLSSHIHELHFLKTIKATNRLTELYNKLLNI